jgi:hypothetical protein
MALRTMEWSNPLLIMLGMVPGKQCQASWHTQHGRRGAEPFRNIKVWGGIDSTIIYIFFFQKTILVFNNKDFWSLGYFELELEPGMLPPPPPHFKQVQVLINILT